MSLVIQPSVPPSSIYLFLKTVLSKMLKYAVSNLDLHSVCMTFYIFMVSTIHKGLNTYICQNELFEYFQMQ